MKNQTSRTFKDNSAHKSRNPLFKNRDNNNNRAPRNRSAEGDQEAQPRKFNRPRNSLKLNEFHQDVRKKHKVSTKKKIRDINRLLTKKEGSIDPTLQEAKQTEIKNLRKKYRDDRKKRFLTQANEQKYKKIKFFEEQKLRRKLKKVQNKIKSIEEGTNIEEEDEGENDIEALKKEKEAIGDDLNYIRYYPKDKKYVALFPPVDDEESQKKREAMRKIVKDIVSKKSVNITASLDRLTNSLNKTTDPKFDTFFNTEDTQEEGTHLKRRIVDKKGRVLKDELI